MQSSLSLRFLNRTVFTGLLPALVFAGVLAAASVRGEAQFAPPSPGTQVHDPAALKPPPGARVAIVEFEDLECPDCARANPVLRDAASTYKIPWVRHDFPLPFHTWSFQAAVNARWFDTRSKELGDEYRNQVFANQNSIETPVQLMQFTQRFAQSHGTAVPFSVDPQGKLQAAIDADIELGKRIGITETPTIYIVTDGPKGTSAAQVKNPDQDLYSMIDQAMAATRH